LCDISKPTASGFEEGGGDGGLIGLRGSRREGERDRASAVALIWQLCRFGILIRRPEAHFARLAPTGTTVSLLQ